MSRFVSAAVLALAASLAVPALAAEPAAAGPAGPAPHVRDGVFLQVQGGPAYLILSDEGDLLRGTGYGLHVAAGFAPSAHTVLFGELFQQSVDDPSGEDASGETRTADGLSLSVTHVGPAFAYYFGDSDFYLVGGLGRTTLTASQDIWSFDLKGFGARVGFGQDFWVGDRWGLGFTGGVLYARVWPDAEEADYDDHLELTTVGLNLTATYW